MNEIPIKNLPVDLKDISRQMNEIPIPIADLPTEITDINTAQTDYLPVGHKDGMATSRMKVSAITDLINNSIADLKRVTSIRGSVDTYAELLAFDVSPLRDGDSIIVWMDDNNEGLSTLYGLKINGLNHNWIYLGKWTTNAGATFLSELGDVTVVNLINGQALTYNGTAWVNAPVTLTLAQSASSVSINNVTIPAASDTMAGVMTATDRQRMSVLHSGAVIDPDDHTHDYMDLVNLPLDITLAAASYGEFKSQLAVAQLAVAQGKVARIVQTGDWIINDTLVHDCMGAIEITSSTGTIYVQNYPLKIKYCRKLSNLTFDAGITAADSDNKTCIEYTTGGAGSYYITTELFNCAFIRSLAVAGKNHTVPIVRLDWDVASVDFFLDLCSASTVNLYSAEDSPLIIYINSPNAIATLGRIGRSGSSSPKEVVLTGNSSNLTVVDHGFWEFENQIPGARILSAQRLFSQGLSGSVPGTLANASAYHFLNALGDWVDRSTLFANGFVKNGGTANQILMADGSIMNDYITTFTPSLAGQTTAGAATYTTRKASVVVKGNLAIINVYLSGSFTSTPSGTLTIPNLPVTLHSSTKLTYPGGSSIRFQTDRSKIVEPYCYGMGTSLYLTGVNPSTGTGASIDYTGLKSGAFSMYCSVISFLNE